MEKVATEIVDSMKKYVPVDTGDLRNSIGWTWGRAPKGSMIIGQAKQSLGSELTLTIYAGNQKTMVAGAEGRFEFQLARLIEFGTAKMNAQPYFYPVWRANKKRVRSAVSRSVTRAVKKAAGK